MEEQKTTSRGRPQGTKSYAAVSVAQLEEIAKGRDIPVSKKWLKSIGVDASQFPDATPMKVNLPRVARVVMNTETVQIESHKVENKEVVEVDQENLIPFTLEK